MFITPAFAQVAEAAAPAANAGAAGMVMQFLPLIVIFALFWLLLIRPQQKKMKEHHAMLDAIRKGDRVITTGGIIGVVQKVGPDAELLIEIAENVRVKVQKDYVANLVSKTEPVAAEDEKK